nr:signaling mucin HKR1-like [Rhipicephalus microplus]
MAAIQVTLLLTLAASAIAANAPYRVVRLGYKYDTPYGAYPIRSAPAVISSPITHVASTYHSTPVKAALATVPSYSTSYRSGAVVAPYYQAAPATLVAHAPSVATTVHTVPASYAKVTKFNTYQTAPAVVASPAFATYNSAPVITRQYSTSPVYTSSVLGLPNVATTYGTAPYTTKVYHSAPAVASTVRAVPTATGLTKVTGVTYHNAPALATYRSSPVVTGVYQNSPVLTTGPAVTAVVHGFPAVTKITGHRSSPVFTGVYGTSSPVLTAAAPATVTTVHAAPSVAAVHHTSTGVTRVTKADPFHAIDQHTVHTRPLVSTVAHSPVSTVAHVPAYGYGVGALGYTQGLPVYGHNYGYGLDAFGYTAKIHKKCEYKSFYA